MKKIKKLLLFMKKKEINQFEILILINKNNSFK